MKSLTSGYFNTAIGASALSQVTTGYGNVAVGSHTLSSNTFGYQNIAIGDGALMSHTQYGNVAIGSYALGDNTIGIQNISIGNYSANNNQTGDNNTIIGTNAGNGVSGNSFSNNSLFGYNSGYALTTGSNNILIGYKSGEAITSGGSNIVIGYDIDPPSLTGSNQLVIGATDLLFGNTSTKRIGIGTTSPGHKFVVGDGNIALSNTGSAGQMVFYEPSASGSNYTSFKAQAQAGDVIHTLPAADGTSGQVLSTNGSGTLSWSSAESPLTFLNGITRSSNTVKLGGNLTESTTITQDAAEVLTFTNSGTANTAINLSSTGDFQIQDNGTPFVTATDAGSVGIGTTAPSQKLTVTDGNIAISNSGIAKEIMFYEPSASGSNYTSFKAQAQSGDVTYTLPNADGTSGQVLSTNGSGTLSWAANNAITGSGAATRVAFWDGSSSLNSNANLYWDNSNSRLGIGTTAPSQQVELTGNLELPATTATSGIIYMGANTFIHNFGTRNNFFGENAGNLTLSGANYNNAIGDSTLFSLTSGDMNIAIGQGVLKAVTTSVGNVVIGYGAGRAQSTGSGYNTIIGFQAGLQNNSDRNTFLGCETGYLNTTGHYNVFVGHQAGYKNTTADNCVALGYRALYNQATDGGSSPMYNTAIGFEALYSNNPTSAVDGRFNVGVGARALRSNSTGYYNTAVGIDALYSNTTAPRNSAFGYYTLRACTTGDYNTAVGSFALQACNTGSSNVGVGDGSGYSLTSGYQNCLFGTGAGADVTTGSNNIIMGHNSGPSMSTATYNVVIGYQAKTTSSAATNCIAIGKNTEANADNQVRLGNSSISSLYCYGAYTGAVSSPNVDLFVDSYGKIGYVTSSKRYKDDILDMEDIGWLYKLRPVNFSYKNDDQKKKHYGLIAEEVEQVNADFVNYRNGQAETVQYSQLIAPMLKALQDQQKLIEQMMERIEELERK